MLFCFKVLLTAEMTKLDTRNNLFLISAEGVEVNFSLALFLLVLHSRMSPPPQAVTKPQNGGVLMFMAVLRKFYTAGRFFP